MFQPQSSAASDPTSSATLKHPQGLSTLFFTEMWERLSFYGMRAILVTYMVTAAEKGGMELSDKVATAIYGMYLACGYLAALPGGWVADRLLGARKSIWVGGILITLGHLTLALPDASLFFLGLLFIVLGTGLLKPNISTLVGQLYPEGGGRRDAGFTIFYMGINLGAMLGPIVCGELARRMGWHYGFGAAGVGMVIGLIQFYFGAAALGQLGIHTSAKTGENNRDWIFLATGVGLLAVIVGSIYGGILPIDPIWLAQRSATLIAILAAAYFVWALFFAGLDWTERKRVIVIAVLFVTSAIFWAGYEQAGSSLTLFAERYTSRQLPGLAEEFSSTWFQSFSAGAVIVLAPAVAFLWSFLDRRKMSPSLPAKFGIAMLFLGAASVVMVFASQRALSVGKVWPTWLMATYVLDVLGELCLSPVGLSSVTKLAPKRLVGQMMGLWFLATSLGGLLAGLFAGQLSGENAAAMPTNFMLFASLSAAVGVVVLILAKPIKKLMSGVE